MSAEIRSCSHRCPGLIASLVFPSQQLLFVVGSLIVKCNGTIGHAVHELPDKFRVRCPQLIRTSRGCDLAIGNQEAAISDLRYFLNVVAHDDYCDAECVIHAAHETDDHTE